MEVSQVVHAQMNSFPAHKREVDHGGFQIAVPKPFLKSTNADAMLKASSRKGVAEFVKIPLLAVRPFGALIAVS